MPAKMTPAEFQLKVAANKRRYVAGIDGNLYDPLALLNDDGTLTTYDNIEECLKANSDRWFEMGLQRRLVITTHQSMEPHDPSAIFYDAMWGWRSEPLQVLNGGRQTQAPKEFPERAIARAKAEVDRLHTETGRTTTLYERHLSVNRVLYVRG